MPDKMQTCSEPGCSFRECPGQGVCVQHGGLPRPDPPRGPGRAPLDDVRTRCSAHRRDGGACRQPAIRGTTVCRMHGGAAFQVREAAADRVVEASIVTEANRYTTPLPTTAREALQAELDRTNGAIAYLARTIERFPSPPPEWLAVLVTERQHLAKLADRMVTHQSRVEDVQAEVRGLLLDQLQMALIGILTDLGHDPDSDVVREI